MQHENPYQQLSENETAALVGLSKKTLQKKRQNGTGPRYVRVSSRCVRYRVADIVEWQEHLLVRSTAEGHELERQGEAA